MKKFFKSFLFIGIILVLSGALLQLAIYPLWDNSFFQLVINILSASCTTIGISMIIGYVIDMTQNSNDYISYIQKRLQETVISRKFICDLSEKKRMRLLNIAWQTIQHMSFKKNI